MSMTKAEMDTAPAPDEDRGDDFIPDEDDGGISISQESESDPATTLPEDESADGEDDASTDGEDEAAEEHHAIPKARFDEVNAKAKSAMEENEKLRKQLEALQAGKQPEDEVPEDEAPAKQQSVDPLAEMKADLKSLRTQAREALLDGDVDLNDELNDQIDAMNRQIAKAEWSHEQEAKNAQAQEAQSLNSVAAEAFKDYPFLDSAKEGYDEDAISAVFNLRVKLQGEGKSPAEALRIAVAEKAPKFARLHGTATAEPSGKGDETRQRREEQQRRKAAGASGQPPHVSGSEKESFKVDVNKLSDAEFAKLPASVKAAARGDIL